jgi:hypothetical protein
LEVSQETLGLGGPIGSPALAHVTAGQARRGGVN